MNRTKQLCWMLALAGFTFQACGPKESTGETVITREIPLAGKTPEKPVVNPYETPKPGAFVDPVAAPNTTVAKILMTNYWVFEHYIHAQAFEPGKSNDFRWYKFNPDGTFTAGQWDVVKSKGSWRVSAAENNEPALIIDSDNDAEDAEWVLQINQAGDEMSWVGVRSTRYQGHLIKVFNLMTMPTQKQFQR